MGTKFVEKIKTHFDAQSFFPWKGAVYGKSIQATGYTCQTTLIQSNKSCVRLNKCGLFSNKHNWIAAIKITHGHIMLYRKDALGMPDN